MRSGWGGTPRRLVGMLLALAAVSGTVSTPAATTDPPSKPGLQDEFLQNLVGDWTISRRIRDGVETNTLKAEWVLDHEFVELHMKDVKEPPGYEALVLIGYDPAAAEYMAYWCDTFGAQYAGVGRGKKAENSIDFVFQYAEGPFHNTFTWDPGAKGWTFLMQAEQKDGTRRFFAEDTVRKAGSGGETRSGGS